MWIPSCGCQNIDIIWFFQILDAWFACGNDTIPTRNGRELGEIWVSKVGTNF